MFGQAIFHFEESLNSSNEPIFLLYCARSYYYLEQASILLNKQTAQENLTTRKASINSISKLDLTELNLQFSPRLIKAEEYYKKVLKLRLHNTDLISEYAIFLHICNSQEKAEFYFIKCLIQNPNDTNSLRSFALFLQDKKKNELSQKLFMRSIAISKIIQNRRASVSLSLLDN